jgi:hypothetical protein
VTDELRDIPGYPDYAITRDGRVWSMTRIDLQNRLLIGKWLSPIQGCNNYLSVSLRLAGKTKRVSVHRLVLEAFVGPCPAGMEACHNNGVRTDNRVENLRWDTRKENVRDSRIHGTQIRGASSGQAKLNEDEVRIIFHAYHDGYYTQREIAEAFGVSKSSVEGICQKRTWSHLWD